MNVFSFFKAYPNTSLSLSAKTWCLFLSSRKSNKSLWAALFNPEPFQGFVQINNYNCSRNGTRSSLIVSNSISAVRPSMPQPALSITHKNSVAFITAVMNSTSRICLMLLWTTAPPANSLVINHPVQSLDGISIWEEEMGQHCKAHDAWVLLPWTHWTDAGIRTTCFISSRPHFPPIYSDNPLLHVHGTGISPWLNALGAVVVHNHRKKKPKKPQTKTKNQPNKNPTKTKTTKPNQTNKNPNVPHSVWGNWL